jgi:hypothetical protein
MNMNVNRLGIPEDIAISPHTKLGPRSREELKKFIKSLEFQVLPQPHRDRIIESIQSGLANHGLIGVVFEYNRIPVVDIPKDNSNSSESTAPGVLSETEKKEISQKEHIQDIKMMFYIAEARAINLIEEGVKNYLRKNDMKKLEAYFSDLKNRLNEEKRNSSLYQAYRTDLERISKLLVAKIIAQSVDKLNELKQELGSLSKKINARKRKKQEIIETHSNILAARLAKIPVLNDASPVQLKIIAKEILTRQDDINYKRMKIDHQKQEFISNFHVQYNGNFSPLMSYGKAKDVNNDPIMKEFKKQLAALDEIEQNILIESAKVAKYDISDLSIQEIENISEEVVDETADIFDLLNEENEEIVEDEIRLEQVKELGSALYENAITCIEKSWKGFEDDLSIFKDDQIQWKLSQIEPISSPTPHKP